jgi:hypothetical protein
MGTRYICHPSNRVKRLAEPLSDSRAVDVRRTFEKAKPLIVVGSKA